MEQSIGYLEISGLAGAIVAADKMLKTAAVRLHGIEEAKGSGWMTVSIVGDVAAVEAAVEEGKAALGDRVISSDVIARPAEGISGLGKTDVMKGKHPKDDGPDDPQSPTDGGKVPDTPSAPSAGNGGTSAKHELSISQKKELAVKKDNRPAVQKDTVTEKPEDQVVTCNLCGDPKCPRKIGEPHKKCIHYEELEKKKAQKGKDAK